MQKVYWISVVSGLGVILGYFVKGIDAFLPAFVLLFQKRDLVWGIISGVFWILILEGCSDITFGSILLTYLTVFFISFEAKEFLHAQSFLFVFILSIFSGIIYYLSILMVINISDLKIKDVLLFKNSIKQIVSFPILWIIYLFLYKKIVNIKNNSV